MWILYLTPKGFSLICDMAKTILTILLLFSIVSWVASQETGVQVDFDDKYLEDQWYAGVAYNLILNRPEGVIQRNLSYNIQLGFIRDIPFTKNRNFGIGMGLGYGTNSYYTNMLVNNDNGISYDLPEGIDFKRSKLETHAIEFPLEIRWRTSNPIDYKFWRIYGGIKGEYLFSRRYKLITENSGNSVFSNPTMEQWQFGLTLNIGYNTWNVHLYYPLRNLLDNNAQLNGEGIAIKPLRVGVIFYIL